MSTSKTIEYKADGLDVRLTIVQSTVRIGMMRTLMMERAGVPKFDLKKPGEFMNDLMAQSEYWVESYLYPSLICAVGEAIGFEHWPITLDEFMELPEPFAYEWEQAVFELNSHWKPKFPETKAEKKALEKKVTATT